MAIRPLNSVAGFSVGETPTSIILANGDITTTNITTTGVSNLNSIGNVKITGGTGGQVISTDGAGNLTFITVSTAGLSNGTSNIAILNNGNITFSVGGNANVGVVTGTGLNVAGYLTSTGNVTGGNITTSGQLVSTVSTGTAPLAVSSTTLVSNLNADLLDGYNTATANTASTVVVRDTNGNVSANFFIGDGSQLTGIGDAASIANGTSNVRIPSVNGNVNISSAGNANIVVVTGTGVNVAGTLNATGNANVGNIGATNGVFTNVSGNGSALSSITGANVTGTVANATFATSAGTAGTVTTAAQPNITSVGTLSSLSVTGNVTGGNLNTVGNVNAPIIVNGGTGIYLSAGPAGYINFFTTGGDKATITDAGNIVASNLVANSTVFAVTANISGNVNAGNANLGNLATANFFAGTLTTAAQPNITSVGSLTSLTVTGTATAGNLSTGGTLSVTGNANVGNLGTAGLVVATGNVSGGNLTTGGVVAATGNVAGGNLTTGGVVAATGNVSGGNLTTAGAVVATGNVEAANFTGANLVANTKVVTDSITNKSGNLVLTANTNVVFSTTGIISAGSVRVADVATPTNDADAATKAYVDNLVSSGIHYHAPVRVESPLALNATYNNGTAGVGATLTNAGANAALVIDGVSLSTSDRVLVYEQANAVQNGVYVVTTVGDGSTAWVLTRSSDTDTYAPGTDNGLDEGSYFFVQEGVTGAGESYVCSTVGTITFGTTLINFAQFSKAPIYTAGTGLTLTNEQFSISNTTVSAASYGSGDSVATFTVNAQGQLTAAANTAITANAANLTGSTLASGITTSSLTTVGTLGNLAVTGNITSGNVYANSGTIGASLLTGTLTTAAQPNVTSVGTLTSLTVTGTATAGNLSTGGTLSVTGNANVGNLGTGGLITATGNVSGGNLTTGGVVAATGNVTGGNLTTGGAVVATGNVSGGNLTTAGALAVTGNASVGNLSATNGNLTTANVSGNIILGNASVTTAISWASATTTAITANQTIASFSVTGVTGVEFVVKGIDSTGSKYSVATVQAVTDGTDVDYSTFGTVNLGGFTGSLAVNVVGGFVRLQVTPASSNSTVWTTQYRFI